MTIYNEFGPEKQIEVFDSKTGLRGFLVIDNTVRGVGKGGLRVADGVSLEEVFRLARAMTYKCTMANLPFGGAKSGLLVPNGVSKADAVKWFAEQIRMFIPKYYVAGPDMSTGEKEMDIITETIGIANAATGKTLKNGGLPHELGSTGYGVAWSLLSTLEYLKKDPKETNVAIEGFGNVGIFTSKFLTEHGIRIVAVSDSKGTIYNKKGLDIEKLIVVKEKTGAVINYEDGQKLETKDLFSLDVDVLIPGARPDSINEKNFHIIKADIIIEAGNVPMSETLEESFFRKGVLVIPDFIANAGGVISSWVEYENDKKPTPKIVIEKMFKEVKARVSENTIIALKKAEKEHLSVRKAAMEIVRERLQID
ncbi:MAG: Glu/Leu/Phe/Val dehydrogenase dimerization domain-containing protein [Candidatus Aenigmatarchaeota archaeon]